MTQFPKRDVAGSSPVSRSIFSISYGEEAAAALGLHAVIAVKASLSTSENSSFPLADVQPRTLAFASDINGRHWHADQLSGTSFRPSSKTISLQVAEPLALWGFAKPGGGALGISRPNGAAKPCRRGERDARSSVIQSVV